MWSIITIYVLLIPTILGFSHLKTIPRSFLPNKNNQYNYIWNYRALSIPLSKWENINVDYSIRKYGIIKASSWSNLFLKVYKSETNSKINLKVKYVFL